MEPEFIFVKGAREHNLKGITLEIPKKRLVVFTGVSGSGKSSLAFDTLYAEGQRRYVESLSAYARQFLGQMEKPHYDVIRGLSPTISIEQKAASNNPRSTVGTITEIHDYLRVLYAAVGKQHCTICGRRVGKQSAQQIADELARLPEGTRLTLLAPLIEQRKGEHKEVLQDARKRGYARARVDGAIRDLDEDIDLDKKRKHDIAVVVDRLVVKKEDGSRRLIDSVETALKEGKGVLLAVTALPKGGETQSIYSEHLSCPVDGISFPELAPHSFSFNNPLGMCHECNGLGTRPEMDPDLIVPDPSKSIRGGAVEPWTHALERQGGWTFRMIESLSQSFKVPLDKPWKDLPREVKDLLLYGSGDETMSIRWSEGGRSGTYRTSFEGIIPMLMRRYKETTSESMRKHYLRYFSDKPCSACKGERLRAESRAVTIGDLGDTPGKSIVALSRMTIEQAMEFIADLPLQGNDKVVAAELLKEIGNRLRFLLDVGLGYLTLDRPGPSLSGGESQRIRLASQMGSELTGVIYILDEPSIGLHQRDNARLLATLKRLRDLGNSVIVVEHDEETMVEADWIADFGPGAGELGGEIVAAGTPREIMKMERSLTGAYLSGRRKIEVPGQRRRGTGKSVRLMGAAENNLKDIDVDFPLGMLVAITGVSGAGKSTLVNHILYPALARAIYGSREAPGAYKALSGIEHLDKVIEIDQKPIGRTPRSNPATYTKVFDCIRDVFARTPEARAYGYEPGRFSFNVKGGRCEACEGDGLKVVEMHFLADVYVPCEVCQGKRFNDATLRVSFKGKNIAEVLDMSVREAMDHFAVHKEIIRILKTLDDVGLGYIKLGQPSPTLSGGEAQRIKLSRELARTDTGRTMYVLDEPTTGLHFEDIKRLLTVLNRLVDAGNTVLVIEHNLDVIKCADHIIDIGPEGGDRGGWIVAVGTPEQVAQSKASYTGQYLNKVLGRARVA
ncbi:MAG: excinuclease ABC subunit UvrA [Deltaproteobacteria bacterium]|nr:MAG: excinuclease ABC subunit UvrA [Deltaproteobacteria bacterium]